MGLVAGDEWKNKKIPGLFHQDQVDTTRLYLFGQFGQRASVIKFAKSNANVDWKLEIKSSNTANAAPISEMNEIYSFVQPPQDKNYIYACGYKWEDPTQETYRRAATMKMSTSGYIDFLHLWGTQTNVQNRDTCRAVSYDSSRNEVVYMLETTSSELRPDYSRYSKYSAANSDALIITMSPGGRFIDGFNMNFDTASISFGIGGNSLFVQDQYYVFGGQSWGFKTKYQNQTYDIVTPTLDSYLMKYDPRDGPDCFYSASVSSLDSLSTKYSDSQVAEKISDRYLLKKMNNLFLAYSSRYSGSFDLADTLKYPKMCADKSINMTDGVTYYRGQKEDAYVIGSKSSGASAIGQMDNNGVWMFQNGTNAQGLLGRWDRFDAGGTIFIQTDSQEAEGKRRTILRGCSRFDALSELYLYVNVMKNTYPDFKTEIETSWTLSVGDRFEYKLPELVDDEKNDIPELFIQKMPNQEYPPFLYYENDTQTLIFTPHSIWYQGLTYYFIILVKETNSDTVFYSYYCTVKMSGVKIDPGTVE